MSDLTLESVRVAYGTSGTIVALDGVDLRVEAGEFVAIEGESGSGKSTLLSVIGLLEEPTSGAYELRGRTASSLPARDVPRLRSDNFSYVFQSFHLLERRSVIDNVALPLQYRGLTSTNARERALLALTRVGMEAFAFTRASVLSGGQRQRVAIARALASEAPILVADEPTGNLDTVNTAKVIDALEEVHAAGATVVLVTHSSDVASRAHRRVKVSDGRVVSDVRRRSEAVRSSESRPSPPGQASRMRAPVMARDVVENIFSRPGRLLSSVAAVAVSVGLVVSTLGLSFAASNQVSALFDAVASREVTATQVVDIETIAPSDETLDRLARLNGVIAVADTVEYNAVVQSADSRESVTSPWLHARGDVVATGRLTLEDGSDWNGELSADEALVGEALAERLELATVETSPTLVIDGVPHVVVGVFSSSPREAEWIGAVLTSPKTMPPFSQGDNTTLITTRPGAAQQVAREAPLVLNPYAPESVQVSAPADPSSMRSSIEASVATSMLVLTLVALGATVLSVTLASLAAAAERRVEFGLRRAVGARSIHIALMLGGESALTGLVGALTGLAGGLVAVLVVTLANRWTPVFDFRLGGLALGIGVVVSVIGSLLGAVRALRIQPNTALKPLQ